MQTLTRIFNDAKKTFLSRKFIMFCLLGIVNTLDTAIISFLAEKIIQDHLAGIIGYILSLQIAFFLSCRFIFQCKPSFKKYKRYLISYIPSFIVYFLGFVGALSALKLPQFWATFLAVMLSGPITFIIIKLYAFGKKDE